MKPWNSIPITDNKEKLVSLPEDLKCVKPHPYLTLGAPYENKNKLWNLRTGVLSRLIQANNYLNSKNNGYSLIVYDTWRPVEVQHYMFYLAFKIECEKRDLNFKGRTMNSFPDIVKIVEKFWAYPTFSEKTPPPHSTGAALDISLVDSSGCLVDMGCEIDEMDTTSKPDFYKNSETKDGKTWHKRRVLLKGIMCKFGFIQHPNEWWHFSYGDQLWAWVNSNQNAIYGKI